MKSRQLRKVLLLLTFATLTRAQGFPFPGPVWSLSSCGSAPVSSNLQIWLKADAGLTCSGGCTNGATVTGWTDQSTNAYTGTVSGTITYNTSQINGKPALTFSSAHVSLSGTPSGGADAHTAFAVIKLASTTTNGTILSGTGGGLSSFDWWLNKGSPTVNVQGLDAAQLAFIGEGSTTLGTTWDQINIAERGHSATGGFLLAFRVNEATDTASTSGTAHDDVNPPNAVGYNVPVNGEFFNGQIAEILYYNVLLTSTQITCNETYLHTRYGI